MTLDRLYERVSARLHESGMSWADLEDLIEEKTGIIVGAGFIERQIKNGHRISRKKFQAMAEIVGEDVVYGKRFWINR